MHTSSSSGGQQARTEPQRDLTHEVGTAHILPRLHDGRHSDMSQLPRFLLAHRVALPSPDVPCARDDLSRLLKQRRRPTAVMSPRCSVLACATTWMIAVAYAYPSTPAVAAQNCPVTGSGAPRVQKLSACGSYFESGSSITCCNVTRTDVLQKNFVEAVRPFLGACPACVRNLEALWCTYTCAPDQARHPLTVETSPAPWLQ